MRATRPDRIAKAWGSGADALVVDLEDAVPPSAKADAREALAGALDPARPVVLRIIGAGTEWHADDLALARHHGVAAVMLAKADDPASVAALGLPVIPLIESARGVAAADAIARADGVVRLAFGTIDFMLDLDLPGEGPAMDVSRAGLALASRAAGVAPPIDGVTQVTKDAEAARADTLRARAFGFTARLAIHPAQIDPIHAALRPDAEEIAWAERIVAAADASDGGAVSLDGEMIDAPVVARVRAVLARA